MARSDGNYLVIRGYVDGTIQGERSFDTQQEAEYYGKQMLAYIKKMNPKAKKVTVDIDFMTNHSPGPKIKTLASRPGAKDIMASEDFASRLRSLITRFGFRPDEVNVSSRFGVGTISFRNQKGKATELVSKLRGAMKQSGVPESAITAREVQYPADEDGPAEHWGVVNVDFNKMPHSRPGAKARFKVEDRFYFGKGRKERFADDVTYSIAAHIGSQPVAHRSVDSLEQAKVYAKQMLEAFKPDAKGKPLLVEVYPVVNYSPQPAVLTLRG